MFQPLRSMCVLALCAFALAAQTIPVSSVQTTAMTGIAVGQTARLNLLNPGVLPPAMGMICSAAVTYMDGAGNVLKTATVSVLPGKSAAVDLHSDSDLSLSVGDRREIRAVIAIPIVPPPTAGSASTTPVAACKLVANLEIFDSLTGRTQSIVGKVETVD